MSTGPVSERSPLLRFVDALTLGGDSAPALLVQLEPDWAAVAMKPSAELVVVLDAHDREPWDVVAERAARVARTEQPEVLSGLLPKVMGVVMFGSALGHDDLLEAPREIVSLERFVLWFAVSPTGVVSGPSDDNIHGVPAAKQLSKKLNATITAALARRTPGVSGAARTEIERSGEAALASESQFRKVAIARFPPYTTGIIVACVAMFVLERVFGASSGVALLHMGALSGRYVLEGHPEVLLAYALLHGGFLHIFMNGTALSSIGALLENVIGGRRMLFVFTITALAAGLTVAIAKPDQLVVGASGGIFGLIGALAGLSFRGGDDLPPLARARFKRGIWSTLLINLFISLLPGVSLLAHAGGFITGCLLGYSGILTRGVSLAWRAPPEPALAARMDRAFRIAGAACIGVFGLCVLLAWLRGQPWS